MGQVVVHGDKAGGHGRGPDVLLDPAAAVGAVEIGHAANLLEGLVDPSED